MNVLILIVLLVQLQPALLHITNYTGRVQVVHSRKFEAEPLKNHKLTTKSD